MLLPSLELSPELQTQTYIQLPTQHLFLMSNRHLKLNMSKTGPLIRSPNLSFSDLSNICQYHSSISQTQIRAKLDSFLFVISHIGSSLDPIHCSFIIHPTSNFVLILFCYHLGPSYHHLPPGLEPQPPPRSFGFYPSQCPTSCPLPHYISDLHAYGLPCCSYHGPFACTTFSAKMLFFRYPRGSFLAPFRFLLKYYLHSKVKL